MLAASGRAEGSAGRDIDPEVAVRDVGLSRRTLLLTTGAVGLLTGCRPTAPWTDRRPPSPPDPDVQRLAGAIEAEAALLARYDATVAAFPVLTMLAPIRADHDAHRAALAAELARRARPGPSRATPAPSEPPAPAGSAPPPPVVEPVSADLPTAVRALANAETAAGGTRGEDSVAAATALAGLLGSIAASEAAHAAVLALLELPGSPP